MFCLLSFVSAWYDWPQADVVPHPHQEIQEVVSTVEIWGKKLKYKKKGQEKKPSLEEQIEED